MTTGTIFDADVRGDLTAAHAAVVDNLALPGDWLRADEKTAVARVVRAALAEATQPPWYTPSSDGHVVDELPAAAVDAAWRLTNHPGTLTPEWYGDIVAGLPSPEYYVELVGVVATINAIDRFADLLDFEPLPLAAAQPGDPLRPEIVSEVTSHWVPTAVDAEGPNVLRAHTVAPQVAAIRSQMGEAQYIPRSARGEGSSWSRGDLGPIQIELIAAMTSLHNECFY